MRLALALTTLTLAACAADPPQRQLAPEPGPEAGPRPRPPTPGAPPSTRPGGAPAPPATVAVVDSFDAWGRVRPGAEFVQRVVMTTKPPLVPVTSEARYTTKVLALDDHSVTLLSRVESSAAPPAEQQEVVPRGPVAHAVGEGERAETTVTVPAGTFPCTYVKSQGVDRGRPFTVEVWYDPTLPMPYKTVIDGARDTRTVELVSFTLE